MKITFLKASMAIILLSGFTLFSCEKDTVDNNNPVGVDSSKITTQYDPSLSLTDHKTIAISDSVLIIDSSNTNTHELSGAEAIYIQALKDSLAARGFTVASLSSQPDLVLNISRISNTSSGTIDGDGYWNKYATYYSPSLYGDGMASYSNSFTVYNPVGTGVLSFELLDLKNTATTNQIPIVWNAQIAGNELYESSPDAGGVTGILLQKSPVLHP